MKEILSTAEAAEFLGMSRNFVYVMARKRLIPHTRVGSRKIFLRDTLIQWLRDGQQEAA